ncbi:MAG TPA: ABC transporter permease, partial [Vicinamibacterales bacterium]|nr:ABC transporter permease [Vicinamibacterales bacterium]
MNHLRAFSSGGAPFGPADTADSPWVVVVDETFAARYLGPEPLGQRLRLVELGRTAEVVGVFEASRHNSIFHASADRAAGHDGARGRDPC